MAPPTYVQWPTCPRCGAPHQLVSLGGYSQTQPACSCPTTTTTTHFEITDNTQPRSTSGDTL